MTHRGGGGAIGGGGGGVGGRRTSLAASRADWTAISSFVRFLGVSPPAAVLELGPLSGEAMSSTNSIHWHVGRSAIFFMIWKKRSA